MSLVKWFLPRRRSATTGAAPETSAGEKLEQDRARQQQHGMPTLQTQEQQDGVRQRMESELEAQRLRRAERPAAP
jgi:hypothetical protein